MRLSKRDILRLLAALPVAAWRMPALAFDGTGREGGERTCDLLAVLDRRDSAAAVGAAYLRGRPERMDPAQLRRRLARSVGALPATGDPHRLKLGLRRAVAEDFSNGRIVDVDGWILAETEAWLCGLAHLLRA